MSIARCYLDSKNLSVVLDWQVGLTVKLLIVIVSSMLILSHLAILSSAILSQLHAFLSTLNFKDLIAIIFCIHESCSFLVFHVSICCEQLIG